jgi:divalent metal cation (Fe/Co/Zn/Cd) transporter
MMRPSLSTILDYRAKPPADLPHPAEIGRVLRYAALLAAGWFLLSGGVVYVLIAVFNYTHGESEFSALSLIVSLLVLVLTIGVGLFLYVLRPRT